MYPYVIGDKQEVRSNFLHLIHDLFGELERVRAEKLLREEG
jgi:hypothetical protein